MTTPALLSGRGATALAQRLHDATLHERRRALRALLVRPLLQASGSEAEAFLLVRRHATWLQEWLAHHPGWSLTVSGERARLRKTLPDLSDGTRPARDPKAGHVFGRRRYVLFCLALAVLERGERQTALGRLADQIKALVVDDRAFAAAGLVFDLGTRDQRRDLVQVVRLLLDLGVLARVHGDEQSYLRQSGDVLYTIQRSALAALLQVRRGPSTIAATDFEARLEALAGDPSGFTPGSQEDEQARTQRLRHSAYRRLLDDPIVYYEDLSAEERAYFDGQRARLLFQVELATGLVAEVRAEGIAMVDERGDATDIGLPEEGTLGHLTLLLAERFAEDARTQPGQPVGYAALHQRTAELIELNARRWSKRVRQPRAAEELSAEVLQALAALRLVTLSAEGVIPRAAIARFSLRDPSLPEPPAGPVEAKTEPEPVTLDLFAALKEAP